MARRRDIYKFAGLRYRPESDVAALIPKAAHLSVASTMALGIALATMPISARAETKVRGTPQAVVVEAANAPVEEVLVALTDNFKVRFLSAANLDKRLTGTYRGTLEQALFHILKGYDIVVKSSQAGGLEIALRGAGKPVAVVRGWPVPSAGGPTPPMRTALGSPPVSTLPAAGPAPSPVPQIGPGPAPSPTPPQPIAGPTPVDPLPTATSAAQPTSPTPALGSTRPVWVAQLIGESSETVALFRFRRLQGKLRSALGSYEPALLRTALKDGTTWVRVRVEFDTRQAAEVLCSKLEAAREPCLVQRN
jgi:hypothetical protein